uniref:Uncharacterized protein n=1 Tax=Arundo donax TaxID=35708 RepID=A0A0A9H032_ARUDO
MERELPAGWRWA